MLYLDFKQASCKNCYKCVRNCPIKAITITNHQAKINVDRCILCGTCTEVCPQNAKKIHSELDTVMEFFEKKIPTIVSVAPSFLSSFKLKSFEPMKKALESLGFLYAEETAVGADAVINRYKELLQKGTYKNFITSCCPAINTLIQLYYPEALPYLARVDSPMVAHSKILREKYPNAKFVFLGPCIAKKKEAFEDGHIDAVLTFEEIQELFVSKGIELKDIEVDTQDLETPKNQSKLFPISRGIIKSFDVLPAGYEYIAIDGTKKCVEILKKIESLDHVFLELNACDFACVKGPCSLQDAASAILGNSNIRNYANKDVARNVNKKFDHYDTNINCLHPQLRTNDQKVSEMEIKQILAKTGKFTPEDELNCGACGYSTCREKAWAVANGYADIDMCLPYMKDRAESMSYEIIQNSPNGIVVVDFDLNIVELSKKAKRLLGVESFDTKGRQLFEFSNPTDYILALETPQKIYKKRVKIDKTNTYCDLTITIVKEHKIMFGIYEDVTKQIDYKSKIDKVRNQTINTADEVIKKQMRVVQEIASLLGETTAESKVALIQLKNLIKKEEDSTL